MKKIKLMLVAFFALLSSTMAFAEESATTIFRYTYDASGNATINGFVAGYATADMATVTITPTVLSIDGSKTYKVIGIASKAFEKNANIKKVIIQSADIKIIDDSFFGCSNLAEIDLSAATGVTEIVNGAFAGTKLAKLDLSKTKITTVPALFGTSFVTVEAADAVLWTEADAADIATHNGFLTGVIGAARDGSAVTTVEADAYNATLTGAKKGGDKITDAAFVAAYNASLHPVDAGQDVDATLAAQLTVANGYSKDYVEGDVLKKADAELYNSNLGLIEVGGKLTADAAKAYNRTAAVAGNIDETWAFETTEADASVDGKKIWNETYNRAVVEDYAYVGGEKVPAVEAVDPIAYATLTEVTLPETWNTIDAGAFLNCSNLATINFGTPKATIAAHTIGTTAFLGTALTALDFSKLKITGALPANLLINGAAVKTNATLKTVTLNKTISNLSGNFANCTALTTIDLTYVTTLNEGEFKGAGLTAITIPTGISAIPASAFEDCTALATVTFAKPADGATYTFTAIGSRAFANTAITAFTVPSAMPYTVASSATTGVAANAFADCVKLKSFTYKPTIGTETVQKVVNDKAFLGCEDGIMFYTVKEYAEAAAPGANKVAPTHSTFSYETSPAAPEEEEAKVLTAVKFKNGNNKYFVKYNSPTENIKIAKTDGKVYAAYLADDDNTIVMQQFKTKSGYYHIAAGDNVIIITDLEKVPYETSTVEGGSTVAAGVITAAGNGSSWLNNAATDYTRDAKYRENMLNYITEEGGVKRSVLEDALPGAGFYIFAWSNTTSATGWLKITSGSTFPQKTLYIYAKPTEAAASARVIWLDENGFVEDETTSINTIQNVEEAGDATIYNVAGQKVNASYRGLVIKNGKKFMK